MIDVQQFLPKIAASNPPVASGEEQQTTTAEVPAPTITDKAVTNATLAAYVVGGIALVAGVIFGIRKKFPWWYYLVLLLVIIPIARFTTASAVLLASKKD